MEENKPAAGETASGSYDAKDMPFDFLAAGVRTALVCEPDPAVRERITRMLADMRYRTTEPERTRDAMKKARFHVYDLVVLNETFDTADPDANDLLRYFSALPMATRRQTFIVLMTSRFRTMDNMAAFNKSVNLVVNLSDMDDLGAIVQKGLEDHEAFYRVFRETLEKMGKC